MAVDITKKLTKGERFPLRKSSGSKLTNFCVGCNWGAIEVMTKEEVVISEGFLGIGRKTELRNVKKELDVDIDLSCVMVDSNGKLVDVLYSTLYSNHPRKNSPIIKRLKPGADISLDGALRTQGDDTEGDKGGDDGLDNEIITVDLQKVNSKIDQIFFFLNIYSPSNIDFLKIPYVAIRMYEGTPERVDSVFAQYDVAKEVNFAGKRALIMGKLYKRNEDWKFAAIGDAYEEGAIMVTVKRILDNYAK